MTRSSWPLGDDVRPRSQAALLLAEEKVLRTWLLNSVLSWIAAKSDEERVRAFGPLLISPQEEPARQFAQWWRRASVLGRLAMEEAVANAIETFDPSAYPAAAIVLLLIGGHFGCAREINSLYSLLAKPLQIPVALRRDFAEAVAFFATSRATAKGLRALAYRLRDAHQLTPYAAMDLLVRAAVTQGVCVLNDLTILVPDLFDEDYPIDHPERQDIRRYWANAMVDSAGAARAYLFALTAHMRGLPELREAIETYRLQLLPSSESETEGSGRRLHDKILGRPTMVNLEDFDQALVATSGAEAAADKRFGTDRIDVMLSLQKFQLGRI